jgi:hypothetical protein
MTCCRSWDGRAKYSFLEAALLHCDFTETERPFTWGDPVCNVKADALVAAEVDFPAARVSVNASISRPAD